jgi:O-succinylbenzoic acid--CoA ligase
MELELFIERWKSGQDFTLHSSGSTGDPKPIVLKRQFLERSARLTAQALKLTPQEHILCCIPTDKAGGFMMMVRAQVLNYPITVVQPTGNPLLNISENHSYTWVSLLPYQLMQVVTHPNSLRVLNRFRTVLVGGADLPPTLPPLLASLKPSIFHTYGMTETYSHVALRRLTPVYSDAFIPIPGFKVEMVGEDHLIEIHTPYDSQPLLTRDVGKMNTDGSFSIIGRMDDMINSGGVKIFPEHIEAKILSMGILKEDTFVISSIPHISLGEELILLTLVDIDGSDFQRIQNAMPRYHAPKSWRTVSSFPFTTTGKLKRKELRQSLLLEG